MSDAKRMRLQEAARQQTVLDDSVSGGARAYAEAILNISMREGTAETVVGELDAVAHEVLEQHPNLAAVLGSPGIAASEKDRILLNLFEGRVHPTLLRFLRLLNRNGRLGILGPIARQARELWNRRLNRRDVSVISAVPLDEAQREQVRARLAGLVRAEPIVRFEVDPTLLGGLIVRVGDDLYDSSLRSQLNRMRKSLVEQRGREVRARLSQAIVS